MGTNFYYYLNRQGVQGLQGPKGKDGEPGISPTIQIKENTNTEFTLEITDANGTFETPNLRIPILDKGGTYYRVDRTDGTLYLDFADKADINTFGEVKLATADTVNNPDPDDVRVVTDEILHDKIVDINNDITLVNNEITGLKAVDVVLDGKITNAITKAEEDLALAEVELTVEINKKQDKLIEGENVTLTPTVNGVVISATGGGGTGDVPIATTKVAGKVKPDGTTITVKTDGTITAKDTTYTVNAPITMTNNKIGIAIDNQTIRNVNGVLHANFDELAEDVVQNTQAINTLSGRVDGVEADIEGLGDEIALKQDTLVSGTNIKTINGIDVLGEGNIEIQGGGDPIDTSKFINTTTTAQTLDGNKPLEFKGNGQLIIQDEYNSGHIGLNPCTGSNLTEIQLGDSVRNTDFRIGCGYGGAAYVNLDTYTDGHIKFVRNGYFGSNNYLVDTTMLDGETITFDPNTKKISAAGGGGEPIPQTPNVITVGNPTITNGMASGFTTTDYLQFPVILDLQGRPFQIDFAFTTGGNVTTQQNVIDSKFGIALAIANGKGLMAISSNGTTWDIGTATGTINIAANTTYYARLTWDGTTYRTLLSTDGVTYNQDMQLAGTNRPFPTTIYIGGCDTAGTGHTAHPFGGTIDLNKAFIYVAGQLFWHGMDNVGLESRADINLGNITEEGKQVIRDTVDVSGKEDKLTAVAPIYIQDKTTSPIVGGGVDTDGNVYFNGAIGYVYSDDRGYYTVGYNTSNYNSNYIELPYTLGQGIVFDASSPGLVKGGDIYGRTWGFVYRFGHYDGDGVFHSDLIVPSTPDVSDQQFCTFVDDSTIVFNGDSFVATTHNGIFSALSPIGNMSSIKDKYTAIVLGLDGTTLRIRKRSLANPGLDNSFTQMTGSTKQDLTPEQIAILNRITTVRMTFSSRYYYSSMGDRILDLTAREIGVANFKSDKTFTDFRDYNVAIPTRDFFNLEDKIGVDKPTTTHLIGIDTTALPSPDVKVDNTTIEVNGNGELQTTVDLNDLESRVETLEQGGGGGGGDVTADGSNTFTGTNTFDGEVNLNGYTYSGGYLTFNNNGFWIQDDAGVQWQVTADTTGTTLNIDGTPINAGVIDAYESGTEGYRVYQRDQTGYYYCEQWGTLSVTGAHASTYTINLLKTYKDVDYNVIEAHTSANTQATCIYFNTKWTGTTADTIKIQYGAVNGQSYPFVYYWKATGYITEEEALGE